MAILLPFMAFSRPLWRAVASIHRGCSSERRLSSSGRVSNLLDRCNFVRKPTTSQHRPMSALGERFEPGRTVRVANLHQGIP